MNGYTIHFRFAREHVEATDSDMAVWKAAEIIAQDMSEEDRGELVAVELHGRNGLSEFFYAGADLTSTEVDEVITRAEPRAAKPAAKLPPRRAAGLTLSVIDGELFVQSFGATASLLAASNEGELDTGRDMRVLSAKQQRVVDEWMLHFDDYLAALA